ncbi:MAG TPA: allantoate amidohydrolase [Pseudonocardiaceae bacterium]|nr:allantoate amidohydrolase [Pseudonocardiaceae bacterium]
MSANDLLAAISDLGKDRKRGGYSRHGYDAAELELRTWFIEEAGRRDLDVEVDRNGNIWAWWGAPGPDAVITGSHLDSVPGGGAFDGPLGVACALDAVDKLRHKGFTPSRPFAVMVFAEEEGGRFGVPCLGSRLLTGAIEPARAAGLTDPNGMTLAEAMQSAGFDPSHIGRDEEALARIGCFVELHVEQGRGLDKLPGTPPIAVATSILAHGRWRFTLTGQGNHAGTTEIGERVDPMLPAAATVLAARRAAASVSGARATVGRLVPTPGGTNVIASSVDFWLDARASSTSDTRKVVEEITSAAHEAASAEGCELTVHEESYGDTVVFDSALRDELTALLGAVPQLPTGAGHDAGILAASVPTAMLFVRNPTGISHAPAEYAELGDRIAGTAALVATLEQLCR